MRTHRPLTIADDPMFRRIMSNKELCRLICEVVTGVSISSVERVDVEWATEPAIGSRGVRLDAVARADGRIFNIELQTYHQKTFGKRFRYYQSCLDADNIEKGTPYDLLPECYIVFICTLDPFDSGLPVYSMGTKCKEDPAFELETGFHWTALNAAAYDRLPDGSLRDLLEYVHNGTVNDDLTQIIQDHVEDANSDGPWVEEAREMLTYEQVFEAEKRVARREGLQEGREQGLEQGREQGLKQGIAQGIEQGEARINALGEKLVADGRIEDLQRSFSDSVFQRELLAEYGL